MLYTDTLYFSWSLVPISLLGMVNYDHYTTLYYVAECAGGCQNGGICTLPDVCTCATGLTGTNCELGKVTCIYNVCSMLCYMILRH